MLCTNGTLVFTPCTCYPFTTTALAIPDRMQFIPMRPDACWLLSPPFTRRKIVVSITFCICAPGAVGVILMFFAPLYGQRRTRQHTHTHNERNEQGENAFAKVFLVFHVFSSFLCMIYGCKVSGGRAGIARQRRSPHSFASRHFWRFANYKVVISNRLP